MNHDEMAAFRVGAIVGAMVVFGLVLLARALQSL